MRLLIIILFSPLILTHCGVKADPVPPATPAEIGRGRPLFRTEDEGVQAPMQQRYYEDEKEPQGEDEDEEN